MLNKNTLLGVNVTNEPMDTILEYLLQRLKKAKKFYIVTPNPEILVYAKAHQDYKNILNSAEISLPDGTGLFLASVLMGKPFRQRIPGVEFLEFISKNTVSNPISMGFLGGRRGVAERTAECLQQKYPHLRVAFVGEEWKEQGFRVAETMRRTTQNQTPNNAGVVSRKVPHSSGLYDTKSNKSSNNLSNQKIDILFVAYGHPKQEEWIYKNLDKIPVKAAMGVGGAFDYISGHVARAPWIVRAIGFEWLFRLIKEPWRFKRQRALIEFVGLVFREHFQKQ